MRVTQPRGSVACASRSDGDSFLTGFVLGGIIFGTVGFVCAPRISRALALDTERPRYVVDEDADPDQKDLLDKVAKLNDSIDEVAAKLKATQPEVGTQASKLGADLKRLFAAESREAY